jgi:hypothetical protein
MKQIPAMKLTNAQHCSIRALKSLRSEMQGPFAMYPGSEHYEVVFMEVRVADYPPRHFLVAPGGCVSEVLR